MELFILKDFKILHTPLVSILFPNAFKYFQNETFILQRFKFLIEVFFFKISHNFTAPSNPILLSFI